MGRPTKTSDLIKLNEVWICANCSGLFVGTPHMLRYKHPLNEPPVELRYCERCAKERNNG